MKNKSKIAVLLSGNGSNLQAILDFEDAHYEVALVLSNRPNAYGITRAKQANIPTCVIDHKQFDSREAFDLEMIKVIEPHAIELVILAGFMRILTPAFIQHFEHRLLNIHPSLLPKYPGLDTHQKALDAGDQYHGLSIHFVTPELDGGPVFVQSVIEISSEESVETLRQKVHLKEHMAYPKAINMIIDKTIQVEHDQLFHLGTPLQEPLKL